MHHILPVSTAAFLLTAMAGARLAFAQPGPPTVATLEQTLDKQLQKLKPSGMTERNVLFQSVQPGRPTGATYPFRVTLLIRDYGPGYPANHYYGETCIGKIEEQVFTLEPDAFGGWSVQGRMTPSLEERRCTANPAAGTSSVPLASLSGASARHAQPVPALAHTAAAGGNEGMAQGAYECWYFSEARMLMNFTVRSTNQYVDSQRKTGTYRVDGATGRVTFTGGMLDGVMPPGYYAVYTSSGGRPKVSFRNRQGTEVEYCEKT